jgi:hypothetical protein
MSRKLDTDKGNTNASSTKLLSDITLGSVKEVPTDQKSFIALAGLVLVFALGISVPFVCVGQYAYAFWFGVVALLVIALVLCLVWGLGRDKRASHTSPTWTRVVPKLPLSADARDDLIGKLDDIRNAACVAIQQRHAELGFDLADIRVNVFLPDDRGANQTGICRLCIPDGLHAGMSPASNATAMEKSRADSEIGLKFWPGQGLTGVVFVSQKPCIKTATDADEASGSWHDDFSLTSSQIEVVHSELKWIISLPLKVADGNRERTIGVLNIDGLRVEFTDKDLQALVTVELIARVTDFAAILSRQRRNRISVLIEEI